MTAEPGTDPTTLYERVGGVDFFRELVDHFYAGVEQDDVLAPLYPERPDFTGARRRLTGFLVQYWGGPDTYSRERGHPRLRMRHLPFTVGTLQRDRWLHHMAAAVHAATEPLDERDAVRDELMGYFVRAAEHLRNDTGLPITSSTYGH